MSKIRLTKMELKAQGDALKRFQRFLPMLQLKKQQLQAEIAHITARIEEVAAREETELRQLNAWVALFSETTETTPPFGDPSAGGEFNLASLVKLDRVVTGTSNIAGVAIPVFKSVETTAATLDLFTTPPWLDDAIVTITRVMSLRAERAVLERERELVAIELNMTTQRVNLFEKVKIPECRENIRIIKIALGDAQTASVTRGKIAKGRSRKTPPPQEEDAA